ncbi:hypothetical protein BIWAKO_05735 [Bosea sp. BIWAKO-01]|nr:hypothetical protein BIWAKO_05735 [Bosea sp. BIWAKO-01]
MNAQSRSDLTMTRCHWVLFRTAIVVILAAAVLAPLTR